MLFVQFVCSDDIDLVCGILESYIVRRLFFYNDMEVSYQTINKFFSNAIKAEKFDLKDFVQALGPTWPNDNPEDGFREAKSKAPRLIKYILRQLIDWEQERSQIGWDTNQKLLLTDIEEILRSLTAILGDSRSLDAICVRFDEVWLSPVSPANFSYEV